MKKLLAIILSAVMMLSLLTASIVADEPAVPATGSANPANIRGESKYAIKSVLSFDETNFGDLIGNPGERCSWELVTTGAASGKALKLTSGNNTSEVTIQLVGDPGNKIGAQDWSEYDGIMWYVDMTGVVGAAEKDTAGSAIRITF